MAYVYKITNDINGKIYVGQTSRSLERRWNEHCRDMYRRNMEKRPLYAAMNKYGVKHFHMELIEECSLEDVCEREKYWIEYYHSFKNGYNATMGGDGTVYADYDLIVATYQELGFINKTAEKLNVDTHTVRNALNAKNIPYLGRTEAPRAATGKIVNQYDLNNNFIQSFPSVKAAAESIGKITSTSNGATSHISDVCRGKRKTAYGYIWRFANI